MVLIVLISFCVITILKTKQKTKQKTNQIKPEKVKMVINFNNTILLKFFSYYCKNSFKDTKSSSLFYFLR